MTETRGRIQSAETIVVKVGTSTITYPNGKLNLTIAEKLTRILSDLKNQGRNVILVMAHRSRAGEMGLQRRPDNIPEKQALAAIEVNFIYLYSKLLGEYGQVASQVLTKDVLDGGKRQMQ